MELVCGCAYQKCYFSIQIHSTKNSISTKKDRAFNQATVVLNGVNAYRQTDTNWWMEELRAERERIRETAQVGGIPQQTSNKVYTHTHIHTTVTRYCQMHQRHFIPHRNIKYITTFCTFRRRRPTYFCSDRHCVCIIIILWQLFALVGCIIIIIIRLRWKGCWMVVFGVYLSHESHYPIGHNRLGGCALCAEGALIIHYIHCLLKYSSYLHCTNTHTRTHAHSKRNEY